MTGKNFTLKHTYTIKPMLHPMDSVALQCVLKVTVRQVIFSTRHS